MANSEDMNKIFLELVQKSLPDKLIVNFVIVAEVADDVGSQLSLFVSDTMSPWLAHGMLEYAIDMINSGEEDDDDE
jgi:hypothetical protein